MDDKWPAKLRIRLCTTIDELVSKEGCPCKECLVQPMCLREINSLDPVLGELSSKTTYIKKVVTEAKTCYKLMKFLGGLNRDKQKWENGMFIGYVAVCDNPFF